MKTQFAAEDLILQRPSLIHSSAVQICVSGMVIALNFILLLHLLFTAMYHFPLSRTNFSLLTISVIALLTGTAVDLALTMSNLQSRSSALYPFSFDYTSVKLPTSERTSVLIFYWTLQAIVAAFANMTHVQMLTLLYSAKPEKLAICILLLPLVILSGITGFLNLSNSSKVVYIGSAMSDVTQAILTLVYNIGLLTWGLGLHRRSAWKVDGGTAGFGLVTCILALFNTVISFIIIRADLYWLINVQLALVVWQSWTAFWWWVGSGVSEYGQRSRSRAKRKAAKPSNTPRAAADDIDVSPSVLNRFNVLNIRQRRPRRSASPSPAGVTEGRPCSDTESPAPALSTSRERLWDVISHLNRLWDARDAGPFIHFSINPLASLLRGTRAHSEQASQRAERVTT